MNPLSVPREK